MCWAAVGGRRSRSRSRSRRPRRRPRRPPAARAAGAAALVALSAVALADTCLVPLPPAPLLPPSPHRKIKEQVFGATSFWVTETRPLAMQTLELGVVVRGNLRGKREAVFREVCDKVAAMFGEGLPGCVLLCAAECCCVLLVLPTCVPFCCCCFRRVLLSVAVYCCVLLWLPTCVPVCCCLLLCAAVAADMCSCLLLFAALAAMCCCVLLPAAGAFLCCPTSGAFAAGCCRLLPCVSWLSA